MRYEPPTLKVRSAIAHAMAQVYERRQPDRDVAGSMPCPRCRSTLSFTVYPSGMSRGRCAQAECLSWDQ